MPNGVSKHISSGAAGVLEGVRDAGVRDAGVRGVGMRGVGVRDVGVRDASVLGVGVLEFERGSDMLAPKEVGGGQPQ